eukprot:767229-Amphidinium_carterae.2
MFELRLLQVTTQRERGVQLPPDDALALWMATAVRHDYTSSSRQNMRKTSDLHAFVGAHFDLH